jgi:hypothetical protein
MSKDGYDAAFHALDPFFSIVMKGISKFAAQLPAWHPEGSTGDV